MTQRKLEDFGECSYVLSFLTYQETLFQTYRQFNFTFQSIVVAIAAAVTGTGIGTVSYNEWLRTTFIVACMFLFSAQFGRIMQEQIDKRGKAVEHWQRILREVESETISYSSQHYLEWLERKPFVPAPAYRWSVNQLNPFDDASERTRTAFGRIIQSCVYPIWYALAAVLLARLSMLMVFLPFGPEALQPKVILAGFYLSCALVALGVLWVIFSTLRIAGRAARPQRHKQAGRSRRKPHP